MRCILAYKDAFFIRNKSVLIKRGKPALGGNMFKYILKCFKRFFLKFVQLFGLSACAVYINMGMLVTYCNKTHSRKKAKQIKCLKSSLVAGTACSDARCIIPVPDFSSTPLHFQILWCIRVERNELRKKNVNATSMTGYVWKFIKSKTKWVRRKFLFAQSALTYFPIKNVFFLEAFRVTGN